MKPLKVFVASDGKGTIVCPQCGYTRRVDAARFGDSKNPVTARCPCGHVFPVSLEIRKAYRKSVFLFGEYRKKTDKASEPLRQMIVQDLSQTGCRFQTPSAHNLKPGDLVYLEIPLTDERKSVIRATGEVRRVDGKNVGIVFVHFESGSEKALYFFLLP